MPYLIENPMYCSDDTEDDYESPIEPDEDDIYLTPSGELGSIISVSAEGKFIGEYPDHESADKAILKWMKENQYYPNVWYVSDHGNITPYKLNE